MVFLVIFWGGSSESEIESESESESFLLKNSE